MGKIILTGDRPTGRLHVGHYAGSLKRRVELQNSGEFDEIYIMIADAQALTDNADNPEKVRQNIIEVALDYLACGLDPEKSVLFITYPISQAADITAFKATTVPVGEDQAPMIEQTREIVHKFNSVYGDTLVEPDILLPDNKACLRLPGIDGKAKMSKSLGNCIYLSDSEDEIKKKIMSMFTDPNHLRVEDPGQVEGNPVFIYLDAFCRDEHFAAYLPDYKNLDELKAHYARGGLGDVKVKRFLNSVLQDELRPIRERRKEIARDIPAVYRILEEGSRRAEQKAAQTLAEMKRAMKINYFEDKELIAEQAERFRAEMD